MYKLRPIISRLLCFFVILTSCNEPTTIGLDIIDDNSFEILTVEQKLSAKPILQDSVRVHPLSGCYESNPRDHINRLFITKREDPHLGALSAKLVAQFVPSTVIDDDFDGIVVDSVLFRLMFDEPVWGDTTLEQQYNIYTLEEALNQESYFSNSKVIQSIDPIGILNFMPKPKTNSIRISEMNGAKDTSTIGPSLLFQLDRSFGERILSLDTSILKDDTLFLETINGIVIQAEKPTNTALSFNISDINTVIDIHYTRDDTLAEVFSLRSNFTVKQFVLIDHDYSSGQIGNYLGDTTYGAQYFVSDALQGVETQLIISPPNLDTNVIIHNATLELFAEVIDSDPLKFPPSQLGLYTKDQNGDKLLIESARNFENPCILAAEFDGMRTIALEDGQRLYKYRLNLTADVQNQIKNKENLILYLSTYDNLTQPAPFVGYGLRHEQFPAKLTLSYTKF